MAEVQHLATDTQRGEFFRNHEELRCRALVEHLTRHATTLLRVDPRDAQAIIETSIWLAESLDDDYARARSFRAAANLAHVKGHQSEAIAHYALARTLFTACGDTLEAAITASSSLQALTYLGR